MKRLISVIFVCVMMFGLATSAFATEGDGTIEKGTIPTDLSYVSDDGIPVSSDQTAQTRAITTVSTGTIAAGGYKNVFRRNPLLTQTWVIGRQSGSPGKIDVEVRNELGVVLGSKAFGYDGDGTLTVTIPWDAGDCTVRVYNHSGQAGNWTLAISGT